MSKLIPVLTTAAVAIAIAACNSYTPPAPPPAPQQHVVHVLFDSAWTETVAFLTAAKLPIQTIERSSGLLASHGFRMTSADSAQWLDCGKINQTVFETRPDRLRMLGDFTVYVRDQGDSVTVIVNLTGIVTDRTSVSAPAEHNYGDLATFDCVSSGRLEASLLRQLRSREKSK